MNKKIIKILIFLSIFWWLTSSIFAYTSEEVRIVYDRFILQLEKKITSQDKQISTLERLGKNIDTALLKVKNTKQKNTLQYLKIFNNRKILLLKSQKNLEQVKKEEQQVLQNTQIPNSEQVLFQAPDFIKKIAEKYPFYSVNNRFEYQVWNDFFRIDISRFYRLDTKQAEYFLKNPLKDGIIVLLPNNQYFLTSEFKKEQKISYAKLPEFFVNSTQEDQLFFLENGAYYGWEYQKYSFFEDTYGVYLSDLKNNSIDPKTTLLVQHSTWYRFTNDYKKHRLVDETILQNVTNKEKFIEAILDDNRFFTNNYDEVLRNIQAETLRITKDLQTDDEKIYAIHKYIVDRVEYYQNYSDGSKQIFSGILTFQNKSGVCDGYTKLMLYMLSFAQIQDVEVMRWFAFDNQDFPDFWHAWVRVGNWYYDPTFDDPIGNKDADKVDFLFYKLPRELIYINRFDGLEIPENLKNLSLSERKTLALKNMYDVFDQYSDYALMNKIKNRKFLWLDSQENITFEWFITKMWSKDVKNFVLYNEDGTTKRIASIRFYQFNSSTLEIILNDSSIDISQFTVLKWHNEDGTFDYRLAYDIMYF